MTYEDVIWELVWRIDALVPNHQEILTFTSAWDLFKVDGFDCTDLHPSSAQAAAALGHVQKKHRKAS